MATDTAELTFVRCPSCRSLVPAVSTRCRMCGSALEAMGAEAPVAKPEPRQEARLADAHEAVIAPTVRTQESAAAPRAPAEAVVAPEAEVSIAQQVQELDDPLGDYLQQTPQSGVSAPVAELPETVVQPISEKRVAMDTTAKTDAAPYTNGVKAHGPVGLVAEGNVVLRMDEHRAVSSGAAPSEKVVAPEFVRRAETVSGRLFGWLVSYAKSEGSSIELREGKFFVSSSSLKPSDLVVHDKSISTPHALVAVSAENGLMVQDLMSDRGVFVRRGNRGAYQRYEEIVQVQHRDWIRFGDVEFLVSLIAHPGEK